MVVVLSLEVVLYHKTESLDERLINQHTSILLCVEYDLLPSKA